MRLALLLLALATVTARAEVTMSPDAIVQETIVAKAAVRLGSALQHDDERELDLAVRAEVTATKDFDAWLAKHPKERTQEVARIVVAAQKLGQTAGELRLLIAAKADGALIQKRAIDGLHRYNEFIGAHQGDPPPKEIPIPDELRERAVKLLERLADDVQANQPDCKKIAAALMKHVDADAKVMDAFQAIDDARPQDQREAEVAPPAFVKRVVAARARMVPLDACKDDPTLAAYRARTNL